MKRRQNKPKLNRKGKLIIGFSIFLLILLISFSRNIETIFKFPFKQKGEPQSSLSPKDDKSDKIDLNGVKLNNFNKKALQIGKLNEVLFVNESQYNITYYPIDNAFLIVITSPFEEGRRLAEERFIQELGISKEDACKLSVYITTPRAYNPTESGINYKLSWCE